MGGPHGCGRPGDGTVFRLLALDPGGGLPVEEAFGIGSEGDVLVGVALHVGEV